MEGVVCAVRGAITVEENTREKILENTRELLAKMCKENGIETESQVISAFFTSTPDLNAEFPAKAARDFGWTSVPLMCAQELEVEGALKSCIRILLHFYANTGKERVKHIYLKEARKLRPDLEL